MVGNNKPALSDWQKNHNKVLFGVAPKRLHVLVTLAQWWYYFQRKSNSVQEDHQSATVPDLLLIMHWYVEAWDWLFPLYPQLWLWAEGLLLLCTCVKCRKILEVTLGTPDIKSRPKKCWKGLQLQLICCTPSRLLSQDFGTEVRGQKIRGRIGVVLRVELREQKSRGELIW